jgi:hypothetical protein
MPSSIGEPEVRARIKRRGTTSLASASALFASLVAVAGCTTGTQDNFTNPPPGPPSSCAPVPALAGCTEGSLSFSCSLDRPDDGDTNLVCDQGTPGIGGDGGGSTLFCCAPYGQWASECTPRAPVPGCGAESIGFSCSGATSPDQVDTSLVCSSALSGDAGTRDYCCISFNQSAGICRCASFDQGSGMCGVAQTGCGGSSIGFTCATGHAPSEVNPLLECAVPDGGGSYCCETP